VATSRKSRFRQAAVVSGLISTEEIDEALSSLYLEEGARDVAVAAVTDEELARKLIDLGRINRWQAAQLMAGRSKFTLGSYRIIDSIGRGGMAEVYKAEHVLMRRVVALKILPRSKSTATAIASFHREIQAQSQLDHENLVRAFDAGHERSVHFLATEYVPGTDLRKHIKRNGRLSMRAGAAIICQAALGLQHAHSRGLIHRDVKPGNLLITPEGLTKVSDLGLAGYLEQDNDEVRDIHNGKIVGTADYLAPEQITAPETVSPASDVYALGCTLYYSVTGKVPFPGGTARDKVKAHCKLQPITPRRWNPDLTDDFIEIIHQMMNKDPAQRVATAAEVVERLKLYAGDNWLESAREVGARHHPALARPRGRRRAETGLQDTRPVVDGEAADFGPDESLSEVSHPTHPMASAEEETLWLHEITPKLSEAGFSLAVMMMIVVGLLTAAVVLTAVIAGMF
jgi:serine/threonine protein kinase